MSLISINDTIFSGYYSESLDIFSIVALFLGIAVIVTKNSIGSLMSLIGLFGIISTYLIFAGLTFIGFSYLIVYIGAVSILFLFILMLIDIRTSELQSNNSNSIPLALFITILLNYILFQLLPYSIAIINNYNNKLSKIIYYFSSNIFTSKSLESLSETNIMFITSNNWDGNITEISHISAIGNMLYTSYNMWLFIASIILLLAMVGAIIITIKPERTILEELVQW